MEEILHQLIGSRSQKFTSFVHIPGGAEFFHQQYQATQIVQHPVKSRDVTWHIQPNVDPW